MAEHNILTDPNLHEPKGVGALIAGASDAGKAYLSDGAGSGSWQNPTFSAENTELSLGSVTNNTSATLVLVLNTYYLIAGTWTEEIANGMTTTLGTGRMNVVTAGDYVAHADISMISSRSNAVVAFRFMVNGIAVGPRIRRKIGAGSDVGAVPVSTYLPGLSASDYIQLSVTFPAGEGGVAGDSVTVENCIMSAELKVAA